MLDAIRPPRALRPDEVCRLIYDALSDGDLDAALTHYEVDAVIELPRGHVVRGHDEIRRLLSRAVEAKLLYDVMIYENVAVFDLALVHGEWMRRGTDREGRPILLRGTQRSVMRRGPTATGGWPSRPSGTRPGGPVRRQGPHGGRRQWAQSPSRGPLRSLGRRPDADATAQQRLPCPHSQHATRRCAGGGSRTPTPEGTRS